MCGICGVFNFGTSGGISTNVIEKMRDTMMHRGPDGAGWMLYDAKQHKAVTHCSPHGEAEMLEATVGFGHRQFQTN